MQHGFLSAVIIRSRDAEKLANFYGQILGIEFEYSNHDATEPSHYECELGDVHLAIFPSDLSKKCSAQSVISLAFAVPSIERAVTKLESNNIPLLYPVVDRGFARMTAILDPDGNTIELTELTERWINFLRSRPVAIRDVVFAMSKHQDQTV